MENLNIGHIFMDFWPILGLFGNNGKGKVDNTVVWCTYSETKDL